MRRIASIGAASLLILICQQTARAALSLTVATNVADLDHIVIGQFVPLRVELSGMSGPADELDFLAATITFDQGTFGPATIAPGNIVPDVSGFQSATAPGLADANYDALFADSQVPISSNGTFYAFEVQAIGLGAGTFELNFVSAMNGTEEVQVGSGPAVSFRVIPEPASVGMLLLGFSAVALLRRR